MTPAQEKTLEAARERAATLKTSAAPGTLGPADAASAGSPPFSGLAAPGPGVQVLIDPATNKALPAAYANMGVVRGFDPPAADQMVMMILALSGAGKTTFVSSIPNSLTISFSPDGASAIIDPRAHRVYVLSLIHI